MSTTAPGTSAESPPAGPGPAVTCRVIPAADLFVTWGTNLGDALGGSDDVCLGDVYQLDPAHRAFRLVLASAASRPGARQTVAPGSERGAPGDAVEVLARHRLMTHEGDRLDVLLLRLVPADGAPDETFALPLGPLAPGIDYALIATEADLRAVRLSDVFCVSFAAGTAITLADGRQAAVETLRPGDRVLTRDHGPQPVRWIGKATLRALGAFAPVVITAGTLGNQADLIVSPNHRLFLYRKDRLAGRTTPEVLVQAKHLVDGARVFRREGGFVDYFSLVFDQHEIIYAEGIPAESLMVNDRTLAGLPEGLAEEVRARFPGLSQSQHFGTEADRATLAAVGPASLFRP